MAKILFLCDRFYPDIGGIETVSQTLASEFAADGHEVHLVTWTPDAKERSFTFNVLRRPTISQLLREFRWADVVFENNPCLKLSWPSVIWRRPWTIAVHQWISRTSGRVSLRDKLKLHWLHLADRVIACSDAVRLASRKDAEVIGNPYDHELFRQLDVSRTGDHVFLGRLVSEKGVDLLIDAFHQFIERPAREKHREATLTIIGDGPDRRALEDQVAKLNLTSRVSFLGALSGEELVEILNRHRYIVIPSRTETFGIVALEGMACGCLPIAARCGGLPDAVGDAGLMFESGSPSALATAMRELLDNPSLEADLRGNAEAHLERHRSTVIAQRYLSVIRSTLSRTQ